MRQARERLGLSEDDVAAELRLSPFQIRALEEDDWERLPGTTYARGYLRSYARLLDLDTDTLFEGITTEELEIAPEAAPPAARTGEARAAGAKRRSPGRSVWAWLGVLAVVAILAGYLWQSPGSLETIKEASRPAPEADGDAAAQGEAGSSNAAGGEAPASTDAEKTSADTPLPDGWARIAFEVAERSWIDVRDARGERLLYRSVQGGRRVEVAGKPPLRVYLGNARAVQVDFSGRPVTPDTDSGRLYARFVLDASSG